MISRTSQTVVDYNVFQHLRTWTYCTQITYAGSHYTIYI